MQMYGNSQGFPLYQVHCLGWCHIKEDLFHPCNSLQVLQGKPGMYQRIRPLLWVRQCCQPCHIPQELLEVDVLVIRDGKTCSVGVRSCEY